MFELQILVPVVDADGDLYPAVVYAAFEGAITDRFPSFFRYPGTSRGWTAGGISLPEEGYLYGVTVHSIVFADRIVSLVRLTKALFLRETIQIRYLGVSEVL